MRLEPLCAFDLHYTSDFHLARPYGNESGTGWGVGDGRVTGERLTGTAQWSNQPARRGDGDGAMLPNARGVVATDDERRTILELMAKGSYFGVNLASADLDETFAALESSGAEVVQEPTDQPYGVRDCAFRDPAGNMLRIQQAGD